MNPIAGIFPSGLLPDRAWTGPASRMKNSTAQAKRVSVRRTTFAMPRLSRSPVLHTLANA